MRGSSERRGFISRFATDNSGATIVIFAVSMVPLAIACGVAVDFSRAMSVRSELQAAADAGALSARGGGQGGTQLAESRAKAVAQANRRQLHSATISRIRADMSNGLVEVTIDAQVPTTLMKIAGIDTVPVSVQSRAMAASNNLEIALVLDNTGSMRNDMGSLRQAARDLTETLFGSAGNSSMLKVAVVPYVGAVNIGNGARQRAWLDDRGWAQFNGWNFDSQSTGRDPGCTPANTGSTVPNPGVSNGNGADRQSFRLRDFTDGVRTALHRLFGIAPAAAQVPPNFSTWDCDLINPPALNQIELFDRISNTSWKGCVEARPAPYDVQDTPPSSADPNTMFVPYFWPDEPDQAASGGVTYTNNYMDDNEANLPSPYSFLWEPGVTWDWARRASILKYNNTAAARLDETPPETMGPNAACPDALLPLTNSKSAVLSKINALQHWEGGGTVSSEGLMWGWRVLSPAEPFTEGGPYGENKKVIVLMTDGFNMVSPQAGYATYSDYTAYGYVSHPRTPDLSSYQGYSDYLNNRLLTACSNAKAAGIEIYTVTFGAIDGQTEAIYRQCATSPPMHYSASASADLVRAFQSIAIGLTELRLAE